jgi:hypothetical protein
LEVFQQTCTFAACHDADAPEAGLDLQSAGVEARLVGVASTCDGSTIVEAGSPEQSLLFSKIFGNPGCGDRMPLAGSQLPDTDLACFSDWISGL